MRQPPKRARLPWWVVLLAVSGVLTAVVVAAGLFALYRHWVNPSIAKARAALDAYTLAQRQGNAPALQPHEALPDRVHADRMLARSSSLDVEVGHWRFGSEGDWICFEGSARTPGGDVPLVAAVSESDEQWHVRRVVSRSGCECSSHEERIIDCP